MLVFGSPQQRTLQRNDAEIQGNRGPRMSVWVISALGLISVLTHAGIWPPTVQAEEPYRPFLEKLRSEQLFDLALYYLDDLEKTQQGDSTFLSEVPLERAVLLQESATAMGARSPGRVKRLDEAEKAFQDFLNKHKNHPRRSEARLGLGNLLLTRADELKNEGDPKAAKPEAIAYYSQAEKLFESTQQELKDILQPMSGARIAANDEAGKALRDKLRGDYRRAELLAAFSTEHKGRSHAHASAEWKKELEKAQAAYNKFYTNETDRQEMRNIALFYRSGIQRDFLKLDDAAEGYSRILGIEDIDELRPLQFKSLTELIQLWASKEQNKFPAAMELIARWEKQIRPDEKNTQDTIDFLLAAARARLVYATQLQEQDPSDRNSPKLRKDARELLARIVRINGPHQQPARELMAQLGMGKDRSTTPVELPKVSSFEEAVKEAGTRIDSLQTEMVSQQTLQETLDKETDPAKQQALRDQLAPVNETITRLQDQSAELLELGLRMFPQGGDMAELNDARYRLAYIELQRGHAWEAIAIGEFLAVTNGGSPTGLQCATVALSAYGRLITDADTEMQKKLTSQLQPFAEFMVATWPESSQAQAAASTLVQLAMNSGDVDKAQAYVSKLPSSGGKSDSLRREIGLRLAQEYFQEKIRLADGAPIPPELIAQRDDAATQLQAGLQGIKREEIDARVIEAINSLVRLHLASGRVDEAAKWMNNPDLAPVLLLRANPDLVEQRLTKMDSYRTALQATISQLGKETSAKSDTSATVLKDIETLIGELRTAAGTDADGSKMLTSIFVSVARDLQELVEGAKTPALKQKLADGMVLLCRQVADSSDEYNTKFWAGTTLSKVAGALDDSALQTKKTLQRESTRLLQSILDKESQSPGWITNPNGDLAVRVMLSQGLQQAGQYQEAIDQIAQVLAKKESSLEMQIAAAEVYQAWGDSGAADKYELAINGALNNGKGGRLIWGWNGLSTTLQKALTSNKDLKAPFFDARYNLAVSYYRHGLANAARKNELLGKAERQIGTTQFLFKDMGGPENVKRFDSLVKNIQKELGKPVVGLKK
ncbi:MAG: hypothetical protein IT423_14675 [Pirellulaceae bacterium]|nr:hypothetical protein [Pirellulaceae bacterium]